MAKPAASRDAFRGLFALYAAKAHHDQKQDGEHHLFKLFGSRKDISENFLELESANSAELLGGQCVGKILSSSTRQIAIGGARYDHASDFLHALLRDVERKTLKIAD